MNSIPRPALHDEDFLTTRQAASLLGVALRTVQLWVVTREIIVAMIRSWNLPLIVSAAEDAFAALIHIGRHPPDLLLTDLRMPGMDGYRMIRHLRAMPDAKPIDVVDIGALVPHEVAERGVLRPDAPSFATLKELIMQRMSARGYAPDDQIARRL